MRDPHVCYLCEQPFHPKPEKTQREHVVSKRLFNPKNTPKNLLTVRAHGDCNQQSKLDEEYFASFIWAQSAHEHVDATAAWKKRMMSTEFNGLKTKVRNGILPIEVSMPVFSPSGEFIGDRSVARFNEPARILSVLQKIVRGLYWNHTGQLLGDVNFEARHCDPEIQYSPEYVFTDLYKVALRKTQWGTTFIYSYLLDSDDPRHSLWWLIFYMRPMFIVKTTPKS